MPTPSQVGLIQSYKVTALRALFPDGTNFYIGFLTSLPSDSLGTGAVEAATGGYARIVINAWTVQEIAGGAPGGGDLTALTNTNALTWAALTGALAAVGIGVWDAAVGGHLMAVGMMTDGTGAPITRNFVAGDQPYLGVGVLTVGLGSISQG